MRKKKWKTCISILMTGIMSLGIVGCGEKKNESEVENSSGKITLNVWHQWSNDTTELKKIYDQAVEQYMKDNPQVEIHTETLDTEAYKTKIAAEFAGKAAGIDVFYYWGAGMARKLVEADKLLPIDEYITDEVKSKLLAGSTSAFEFDGKLYSLPSFSWYMTLFCNQELFDKAGVKLPSNYEELLVACEKLKELEGITPIAAGAKDGWNAAFMYQALAMREVGADKVNQMLRKEVPFGEDKGYENAAKKVLQLYEMGAFGKNPLESSNDDSNTAFLSGKAAMRIMGSWFANQVYTDSSTTIDPKNVVACQLPMVTDNGKESDYCGGFVESFWVNKNTKYAKEAAKFAIYINEQVGKAAYETGTGFCGWDIPLDDSALNPLFIQIKELVAKGETGVLAWDTSLDANPATVHNEQVQTLFADGADVEAFMEEQKMAINH